MTTRLKTVFFVGELDDPVSHRLRDACLQAGYRLTECWVEAEGSAQFTEDDYDVIFSMVSGLFEAEFFELDLEENAQLILAPCDIEMYDRYLASAEQPDKWVGFSAVSLTLQPEPILELCVTENRTPNQQHPLAKEFIKSLGFQSIWVPPIPGLILARVMVMLVNEAVSASMEGTATPEAIDTAMTLGTNYPMGPLRWADKIGLDKVLTILEHLEETYRDDRYRPMLLLTQKVLRGELGQKSGQGFYCYQEACLS